MHDILQHKQRCKHEMRVLGSEYVFARRPIPAYVLKYCALDVVFLFNMYWQWLPMCKGVAERSAKRIEVRNSSFIGYPLYDAC